MDLLELLHEVLEVDGPLLPQLLDIRSLLQEAEEVPPDKVGFDWVEAQDLPMLGVHEVEAGRPAHALEELVREGYNHGLLVMLSLLHVETLGQMDGTLAVRGARPL